MRTSVARRTRSLFAVGALALIGACKGDANEQRVAPDTAAARTVDSTEALAFIAAVNQSKVEAAQIGTRRASDTEVRQFAQLLWREHAQSGRDVAELARQMELDLRAATPPAAMLTKLRAMSQQTSQLLNGTPRGAAFDRAYIDSQIRTHQAVLQDLRRIASDSGRRVSANVAPGGGVDVGVTGRSDPAAAAAAAIRRGNQKASNAQEAVQMMVAHVQQHLERARQIQSRLASGAR